MEIVTQRDLIRDVAKRWRGQYPYSLDGGCREETYNKLVALDLETASAEEVNEIIGNGSWTRLECHSCEQDVERIILMKGVADDEYGPSRFCYECIGYALSMFEEGR